jgi:TetR/AcrR family transcriptional regulator
MGLKGDMTSDRVPSPRARPAKGRPRRADSENRIIPDALLAAANECIASEKTSNVSVRQIAQKAGVNQAMINYYFNNKDGLLLALFEANFLPLVKKLRAFEKDCRDPQAEDVSVARLITLIDEHFENSPSLFVLHKDSMTEGSGVAGTYSEDNGARGYTTIVRIMRLLMDRGVCRSDISPQHAAYMICILGAVHHVMTPIFDIAFRGLLEGDRTSELASLATQLLKPPV